MRQSFSAVEAQGSDAGTVTALCSNFLLENARDMFIVRRIQRADGIALHVSIVVSGGAGNHIAH